jgi:hypothetical protein
LKNQPSTSDRTCGFLADCLDKKNLNSNHSIALRNEYLPCDPKIGEYLAETTQDMRSHLQRVLVQSAELSAKPFFMMMLEFHARQVDLASVYFESMVELTEEADLVEIRLRRSLIQMEKTFRLGSAKKHNVSDPSRLIGDREARKSWRSMTKRRKVPWISVEELATRLDWPAEQVPLLNIVLDFPLDGFVTPYKWNAFVSLFGPWRSIKQNFVRFVVGGGFVGFMGRGRAERLLAPLPPKTVLMRASRTHASVMALTYRSSTNSAFVHLTNNSNFWSLPDFGHMLKSISNELGVVSHSSNVYVFINFLPVFFFKKKQNTLFSNHTFFNLTNAHFLMIPRPIDYFVLMFERSGYRMTSMSMSSIDLDYFQDFDSLPISQFAISALAFATIAGSLENRANPSQKVGAAALGLGQISSLSDSSDSYFTDTFAPPPTKHIIPTYPTYGTASLNPSNAPPQSSYYLSSGSSSSDPSTAVSSPAPSSLNFSLASSSGSLGSSIEFSLTETRIPSIHTVAPVKKVEVPKSRGLSSKHSPSPTSTAATSSKQADLSHYSNMPIEEEIRELKQSLLNPNRRSRSVSYRLLLTKPIFLDCTQLEKYLSEAEFTQVFGMPKVEFETLPYASRRQLKQHAKLQ